MNRIRRRPRIDRLETELRPRRKHSLGRWVYLGLLLALLAWLVDLFFGQYLYLRAEGIVTRQRFAVASPTVAQVEALFVKEGDAVKQGARLAEVSSLPVLQQIANLSSKIADVRTQLVALTSRRVLLQSLMPIAEKHAREWQLLRKEEERAIESGLTSSRRLHEFVRGTFDSRREQARMASVLGRLDEEEAALAAIAEDLGKTLERIRSGYSNGTLRAAVDGRVANLTATPGSVVVPGTPIMELLNGDAFVLAYLTPGSLHSSEVGDRIRVRYGVTSIIGEIEAVLPISAQLPEEFQRTFLPTERSQILHIRLPAGETPPVFTKVTVISTDWLWRGFKSWWDKLAQ